MNATAASRQLPAASTPRQATGLLIGFLPTAKFNAGMCRCNGFDLITGWQLAAGGWPVEAGGTDR